MKLLMNEVASLFTEVEDKDKYSPFPLVVKKVTFNML